MEIPSTIQHRIHRIERGWRPGTRGVVIHTIESYNIASTESYFRYSSPYRTGAHLGIGFTKSYQWADLNAFVYHAPGANSYYVGIEHAGYARDLTWKWLIRKTQRKMSANRTAWICYHYKLGIPTKGRNVFGHKDFPQGGHIDPGWSKTIWFLYIAAARRAYRNLSTSRGKKWTR